MYKKNYKNGLAYNKIAAGLQFDLAPNFLFLFPIDNTHDLLYSMYYNAPEFSFQLENTAVVLVSVN